jgi:ribose 5-phosphate isomerase B
MKIAIGADHAGFELKQKIRTWLEEKEYEYTDFGTHSCESVDYPDYAHAVASAIETNEYDFGIMLCGSANGVAMAANKHQEIRAAICWTSEISKLARQHNDANILCIPARFVSDAEAKGIFDAFFDTEFEGGRHQRRVEKIKCA